MSVLFIKGQSDKIMFHQKTNSDLVDLTKINPHSLLLTKIFISFKTFQINSTYHVAVSQFLRIKVSSSLASNNSIFQ